MKKLALLGLLLITAASGCSSNDDSDNLGSGENPVTQPDSRNQSAALQKVTEFSGAQVTGVTVSDSGRTFANFPRWREGLPFSVVEIMSDGTHRPYPTQAWNDWSGKPEENKFTCVQSVVAHGNSLFVLDPSSPMLKGVVGTPMLYEFDLTTNELLRKWAFSPEIAPARSYLNDLRIDDENEKIYITESGLGALVILDMKTGSMRRVLDTNSSVKTEPLTLVIDGKPIVKENGLPRRFNVDGIGLNGGYLYYHAVTSRHLYRIPTRALGNFRSSPGSLDAAVEDLGETPLPDGMIFDAMGNLFMADLENHAVVYRTPAGEMKTLVKDVNLQWADTFAIDPKGFLLISDSKINMAAPGASAAGLNFPIYRAALPVQF